MPDISAVIITLNEELNIERCLLSVRDIADEIIVVDSFSTDRTEEICSRYGVNFSRHAFNGYREQKQYAINLARFDHILLIDADEALSEELRVSILSAKKTWTRDGYSFNRLNSYCGQWIHHSGWYPDRKIRLFDRRKASVQGRNPHDEIVMSEKKSSVKHLKGDLLHYTYLSVEDHIRQINRFTEIQARDNFARGKKSNCFSILFGPAYKFIRTYFFHLGFLDGYYGYLICRNEAYSTFLKHAKLKAFRVNSRH
jgi:glycosyltransferase involved in cell wall biosynthesis